MGYLPKVQEFLNGARALYLIFSRNFPDLEI